MRRLLSGLALILTTLALVPGCSPQATSYVREDVDYSFIRTVAIFPFKNLSQDVHANDRVYSIFTSQLLAREAVEVVEYGAVLSAMAQMRLNLDSVLDARPGHRDGQDPGRQCHLFRNRGRVRG